MNSSNWDDEVAVIERPEIVHDLTGDPDSPQPPNEDTDLQRERRFIVELPNNKKKLVSFPSFESLTNCTVIELLRRIKDGDDSPPVKIKRWNTLDGESSSSQVEIVNYFPKADTSNICIIPKDEDLPRNVNYFLTNTEKHDCFFVIESETGEAMRIGAVKLLLGASSEPLRTMLEISDLREQGDIVLKDTDLNTFINFLKCVYGSSNTVIKRIPFKDATKLLYLIEKYLVLDIKDMLVHNMIIKLEASFDSVFDALLSPVCLHNARLEKIIQIVVQKKTKKIIDNAQFASFTPEAVLYIVKQPELNISEVKLWNAVLSWAQGKCASTKGPVLREYLAQHLKYIRFCSMSHKEFILSVVPADVLTSDEVFHICKSFGTMKLPEMQNICNEICSRESSNTETFTFTINMEDVNSLTVSNPVSFCNFSWCISAKKVHNRLGFDLICEKVPKPSDDSLWSCIVEVGLILVSQGAFQKNMSQTSVLSFSNISGFVEFSNFCSWQKAIFPSNGFVKNGKMVIVLNLKLVC